MLSDDVFDLQVGAEAAAGGRRRLHRARVRLRLPGPRRPGRRGLPRRPAAARLRPGHPRGAARGAGGPGHPPAPQHDAGPARPPGRPPPPQPARRRQPGGRCGAVCHRPGAAIPRGLNLAAAGVECTAMRRGRGRRRPPHHRPAHLGDRRRHRQAEPDPDGDRRRPCPGRYPVRQHAAPGQLRERADRRLHLAADRHGRADRGGCRRCMARSTSTSPASTPCATS